MACNRLSLLSLIAVLLFTGLVVLDLPHMMSHCFGYGMKQHASLIQHTFNGKKIHLAIMKAKRESDLLAPWPTTSAYTNSTDYFWDAFTAGILTTNEVKCLTHGVESYGGTGKFKPENIAWTIAANVHEDLPDFIPILITRNLDARGLVLKYDGTSTAKLRLDHKATPLGDIGFAVVRLDGAGQWFKSYNTILEELFFNQEFDITGLTVNGETLKYLTPWETVAPGE